MDWNRHFVKGPRIGVAALAVGLAFGISACSHGSSSTAAAAATTSASSPVTTPATLAPLTKAPATSAAPVPTRTSNGNGGGTGGGTTGGGSGGGDTSGGGSGGGGGSGSGGAAQNSVLDSCDNQVGFEPSGYTINCADGNYILSNIQWTTWTKDQASGNATAAINDCNPDCASGTTSNYPVYIEFDGEATDPVDQTLQTYMYITLSYTTDQRPPGVGPSQNFPVTR
jgi:hypothetical protein